MIHLREEECGDWTYYYACCVMIGYIVWFRITGSLSIIIVYGMFEGSFPLRTHLST